MFRFTSWRSRRLSSYRAIASVPRVALLLVGLALAAPVRAGIEVTIGGVDPELEQNIRVFLSLERYRQRDDLDAALLERLQERVEREVRQALRPFGYYEPEVRSELTRVREGQWRARIDVTPGRPVILEAAEVRVEGPGADEPAFQRIVANPALQPGQRLSHREYDRVKGDLQRTAATLGYLDARLGRNEMLVDPPRHLASVALVLQTGERYRFGATRIEQNVLRESLVRRYLRYEESQPFDATELLRTQFALDDSQYFTSVEVLPGAPDREARTVPVEIRAEPNRRDRFQFGLGYGTDTSIRGTASWENRLVNRNGHRFRVDGRAAEIEQSIETRYIVPIGDPAVEKFELQFRGGVEQSGDLELRSIDLQPSITQLRGNWQRVLFAIVTRTRTVPSATQQTDTLLIPGISYASVPQGYLGEALFSRALYAELRGSTTTLGSSTSFVQLRVQGERVFDLAERWHLLTRGEIGASVVPETEDLPGSQRFFAGGDRSVRGFAFDDLSPRNEQGQAIGGRHYFVGTVELIRDLPRNLGVALFVDLGNAFDRFGDDFAVSAGIGFRWRLPVVTVGIDVAQPLRDPRCVPAATGGCSPVSGSLPGPRLHLNFSPKL